MLNSQCDKDAINPDHYTARSVECIEFTRHMSFSVGNAFKYAWRLGRKDEEVQEMGKIDWYVKDALIFEIKSITEQQARMMVRRLTVMREEFNDRVWLLLLALINAAGGDYSVLELYAEEQMILGEKAHEILFESEYQQAA